MAVGAGDVAAAGFVFLPAAVRAAARKSIRTRCVRGHRRDCRSGSAVVRCAVRLAGASFPRRRDAPRGGYDAMVGTCCARVEHVVRGSPDPAHAATEGLQESGRPAVGGSGEVGRPAPNAARETCAERAAATHAAHVNGPPVYYAGDYYTLGVFGKLRLSIGYYIDSLTICMFCLVTLIASCIHFYAMGYMHDELHEVTDHEVTLRDGSHLKRRGRYSRVLPVHVPVLLQHAGAGAGRQHRDGVRVLGIGGHLLVLPDRLLHRAQERLQRGEQGVHRQPRGRLRHDHRPDGPVGRAGHVCVRRHGAGRRGRQQTHRAGHLQPGSLRRELLDPHAGRLGATVRPRRGGQDRPRDWGRKPARSRSNRRSRPRWRRGAAAVRTARGRVMVTACWCWPGSAFSAAAWARAPSSRCTSGCRTRWKARRPCRPSSTRRRWSRPASIWWAVSSPCSRRRCCW